MDQARPQVWVEDPARFERARALIDEYLARNPWAPPKRCPACGEENPAAFEICWKCAGPLG